jgi:single-stranded DNA-specific DHH superfamily exonuclease
LCTLTKVAGRAAAASAVVRHPQATEAFVLLEERFNDVGRDGRSAYAAFLESPGDEQQKARLRQEAVATVGAFLRGLQGDR